MGNLAKSIIGKLKLAKKPEDLDGWIWKAGDLLAKSGSGTFHSGFEEIDKEEVTREERQQIQGALLEALGRNSDPRFVSQILEALRCFREQSLKQLYIDFLATFLKQTKASSGVIHSALLALDDLGEPVFDRSPDGGTSQSVIDVDKNIRQADRYLQLRGISTPW
ncbi:MAG TPA: hypothetical protein VGR55_11105 [Candidatus Acidoferrum sp.]|nr:hypothetical protein [Candidatus Acidoferrum sp.]